LTRFWRAASPTARRLAGLLAASPVISLPVIRLVRQALLPEARQVHEAEVLLGDLLRVVTPHGEAIVDPDELRYEFRDGLRTVLLDAVPAADALTVLEQVSSYIEEHFESGIDFRAVLADPAGARGCLVADESPFARVAAEVLLRLGGDYARLIAALPADAAAAGGAAQDAGTVGFPSPPGRIGAAPPLQDPPPLASATPTRSERFQQKLSRVRHPRVHITYDVETQGANARRELPFVVGVLADLSGHHDEPLPKLINRTVREMDRDNFEAVMRTIRPGLDLNVTNRLLESGLEPIESYLLPEYGTLAVALRFGSLEDFRPDAVAAQIEPLRMLVEKRRELFDQRSRLPSAEGSFPVPPLADATDEEPVETRIARIDHALSLQLNEILHHPDFQRLEATWRGLHFLIHQTETGDSLKIRALNVSKRDLVRDLEKAVEFDQSALFAKVYEDEFGSPGGQPNGLLIGDYEFSRDPEDVALLEGVSHVAAAAHAPFVAAASHALFGMKSFAELGRPRDLSKIFDSIEYAKWQSFRKSEDSRFVALALPRVLGRLPYGPASDPVDGFSFDEQVDDSRHDGFLWMSAAWTFAGRVAEAMAKYGWPARIRGVEGGGLVTGLPVHTFPSDQGDIAYKCPTEIAITDRREYELARLGFLPLVHVRKTDSAAYFSVPSCQKPPIYDSDEATANAAMVSRLDVVLCVSRFVHVMKVMARDKIGSFMSRDECHRFLNDWITNYVTEDDFTSAEVNARKPLREARIDVEEIPGRPGTYRAVADLRTHFQLDELPISVRVVADLPSQAN